MQIAKYRGLFRLLIRFRIIPRVCTPLYIIGAVMHNSQPVSYTHLFFETNGLSTDGLSRSDVKAVYRDITTQRFTRCV